MQIKRTRKVDGVSTVLPFDEAVDQFIKDNHTYAEIEDDVDEYLSDMSTVFETQGILRDMEGGSVDAGHYIYSVA